MKFIINPAARGGKARKLWEELKPEIEKDFQDAKSPISYEFTKHQMDAAEIAANCSKEKCDTVVVFGGDGTINEVVNGLMRIEKSKRPKLGIIPYGTGGDLIKTIDIPKHPRLSLKILKNSKSKFIDIGLCEFVKKNGEKTKRYYINITEFGVGGYVADMVNRYGKWARGTIPFLIFAIACNFTYKNRNVKIETDSEDERFKSFESNIRVVAVANGKVYGGGMIIAPFADPFDGLFDIVVVKDISFLETLTKIPLLYQGEKGIKKVEKTGKIAYFRARKLKIYNSENIPIEMEGEVPGHTPQYFEILPSEIEIIVP